MMTVWGGAPTKVITLPDIVIPHPAKELGLATVSTHKDKFVAKFDLIKFTPDEVVVKVEDGFLIVSGEHREKCEGGIESVLTMRSFCRRIPLPLNSNEEALQSEHMGTFYGNLKVTIPQKIIPGSGKFNIVALTRRNSILGDMVTAGAKKSGPPPLQRRASSMDVIGSKNSSANNNKYSKGPDDTGMECTKESFVVRIKVPEFSPEEIKVKTMDEFLSVECSHKEKKEGNEFITRTFKRRYALPVNAKKDELLCRMSFDGLLKVKIPRSLSSGGNERIHQVVVEKKKQTEDIAV